MPRLRSYNRRVTDTTVLEHLGSLPVKRFMREFWQRRPLLIRGALPDFVAPVDRHRLLRLARDAAAESRLVTVRDGRWSLREGPFTRLPSLRTPGWTVLVQGVDLLDDAAHRLLQRFRFVPDARLDDLMVSLASDGGGVGPHVDSYDVFLLQAAGRRRWRISRQRNLTLRDDVPLKLLANFRATREWILEPGDMLYLPPGIGHEGVAIGESLTYSIGFRAPMFQELLEPWFADFAQQARLRGRYADAAAAPTRRPAELPAQMVTRTHAALSRVRPAAADTERFLLRSLTEPKPQVIFDRPARPLGLGPFTSGARRRGLDLDRRTRMLHSARAIGINGESLDGGAELDALRRLADRRRLGPADRIPAALWHTMHAWYLHGWIHLSTTTQASR